MSLRCWHVLKNIIQDIDSWANDFSEPEPESDSDSDVETNRFFNQKWCWNGFSIFEKRESARLQQQLMAVEHHISI